MVYWITGRPKSGKSTLAEHIQKQLHAKNIQCMILDGDDVRQSSYPEKGFERHDILTHLLHMGIEAKKAERNGITVIIACVSPYYDDRKLVQKMFDKCIEIELQGGEMAKGTVYESWRTSS